MRFRLSALALLLAALLAACATSPTGRSQFILIGDGEMAQMGATAFDKLKSEGKVSSDRRTTRYVQCIARHVTNALPGEDSGQWDVVVFEDDSPNAFALPGGKIGVHTGILKVAKNQDQLATVMAHEVAHVIARHGAERVSQQFAAQTAMAAVQAYTADQPQGQQQMVMALLGAGAQVGILLPFSRTQESEADQYGLELMARAGFDPAASVELWQNMKAAGGGSPPEFLSTHPAPDTRIQDLRRQLQAVEPLAAAARQAGKRPDCR